MRSLQLPTALAEFVEAAAVHLQAEIDAGAEVPFELEERSRRSRANGPALYCYHPLTDRFVAERMPALAALPSYAQTISLLERFEGLARYLASAGEEHARTGSPRGAVRALELLLADVFAEQTDFHLEPERLHAALARVERSTTAARSDVTLLAGLHGLTITSDELALTSGLTIAHPHALDQLPPALTATDCDLVVALALEQDDPAQALAHGAEVLGELLRALRLFGDGRLGFGPLGWAQVAGGAWTAVPLAGSGRANGMLVVTADQEDELRAFCNLVSRRSPHGDELAWALRRYELGCERLTADEALTDHLHALRALLEPEGPASGLMAGRLAALCATPEQRLELTERVVQAIALERAVIAGTAAEHAGAAALVDDIARHLRALLRDVICGHLTPDLVGLADELLLESAEVPDEEREEADIVAGPELEQAWELEEAFAEGFEQALAAPAAERTRVVRARRSAEEVAGDEGEASEVLDLLI